MFFNRAHWILILFQDHLGLGEDIYRRLKGKGEELKKEDRN